MRMKNSTVCPQKSCAGLIECNEAYASYFDDRRGVFFASLIYAGEPAEETGIYIPSGCDETRIRRRDSPQA